MMANSIEGKYFFVNTQDDTEHEECIHKYFYVIEKGILYILEICSWHDKTYQCRVALKRNASTIFCDLLDYKTQYIVTVAERDVNSLELFESMGDALDVGVACLHLFGAEQML